MRWFNFAFLNVFRNGRRSLFTILIAAVAVASIIITSGFALFTYQSLAEKAARDEGNFIITLAKYFNEQEDVPLQYGLSNIQPLREQFTKDNEIQNVLPRINFNGLISNGEKSAIFIGLGVEPEEFMLKGPFLEIESGQALSVFTTNQQPQIMLGKDLARSLKVLVGDYVTLLSTTTDGALNAMDFQVNGIYSTGVPELDKRQLYVELPDAQSLLYTDKVSSLSVYLFDIGKTQSKINQYQPLNPSLLFTPWWQQAFYYQSVKDLYTRIFSLLGGIMVLLVFFSISNTMAMTVAERTREIGTAAAMGSYQWEIIRNFVLESSIIGFLGGVAGITFSVVIAWGLIYLGLEMPPPPGSNQGYPLVINFSWRIALIVTATVILVCVLAALKAAYKGTAKPITEALSHV